MTGSKDERGVSEVIGVVLMVAITVIIAAIVANTAMNLGSDVEESVQAGVTADFDSANNKVDVVWVSNNNAQFVNVTFTWGSNECEVQLNEPGSRVTLNTSGTLPSGCTGSAPMDGDEVTVTAVAAKQGDQSTMAALVERSGNI